MPKAIKQAKNAVEKETKNYLQPYFAMLLVGALSILLWFIGYQAKYMLEIAISTGISTAILSFFIWKSSQRRRDFGRIHSTLSMVLIGIFLILMVCIGPNSALGLTWLLGGLTLAVSWNIRTSIRNETREDPIDDFFEKMGMPGTRWRFTKRNKDISEGTVQLKRGEGTVEKLQRLQPHLASLFGVPKNNVRITENHDDASKANFKIVRRDLLKEIVKYEYKPEKLTPNDPITVGRYEDGTDEKLALHDETLGAVHMLIQGMNGSGKSEGAKLMFAEMFKRTETEMWVIDVKKGEQTLAPVMPYLDWVITQEKIADFLFKKFPLVIKDRATYLGKKRMAKWEPGCGLSFIYLHIEEASQVIANNPRFIAMMETARSTGIQITASLQRASFRSVDTDARAQFSAVLCFGVKDIEDAAFALPDEVIDAGANPGAWRNKKPGYNYLVHPYADDDYWTTPARTKLISDEELEKAGKNRLPHELDSVTLGALGDLYKAELDSDPSNDDEETEDFYTDEEREEVEEVVEEFEELKSKFDDSYLQFDVPEKMGPDEAKEVFEEALQDLRASGNTFEATAQQLKDVITITGLSRAWLYKRLGEKVASGELEKNDNLYTFRPNLRRHE